MTANLVSRYPVPDIKDMPDDIREVVLAVQEKVGFVPNVLPCTGAPAGRVPGFHGVSRGAHGA